MSEFHLLRPWWLLALLPWAGLLWRLWRSAQEGGNWQRVCEPALLAALLERGQPGTGRAPLALLGLAGGLAILALAGPTWERQPTPVYTAEDGLVILFDLSRSMDSPDLAPDRLTRARYKVTDLLRQRRDGLTGLVVFGGDAFLAAPLSDDTATITHMVDALETRLMPVPGSRLGPALAMAGKLFEGAGIEAGTLLLVSDGEGLEAGAEAAVAAQPHRLLVLGVGTEAGAPIPDGQGFFKDAQGNIVVPGLDPARLQALARAGDGIYRRLVADDRDVRDLLRAATRLAPEGERVQDRQAEHWRDFGPWLVLPLVPLAAIAFRRGILVLLAGLLAPWAPADAADADALWHNRDQRAYERLQAGDYDGAAATFADPRWRAAALFRAGRWRDSIQALGELDDADDWYNRGNALAASGQHEAAMQAYATALERDPEHPDAAHNLARLRELQRGQPGTPSAPGGDPANREAGGDGESAEADADAAENAERQGEGESSAAEGGREPDTSREGEPGQSDESGEPGEQAAEGEQSRAGEAGEQASRSAADRSGQGESGDAATRHSGRREADEQWLRRIQEDPAELLRRKFLHLSRQRGTRSGQEQPW